MSMLTSAQQAKLLTKGVCRLMDALHAEGGEARIVGGAVRDVVMERDPGDIDLAANLPPQRVIEILAATNIKTVPTGLAHGTITAVVDHQGYEITTLRRDVETDGRHAQVEFTDDWQADAARRDFTFNALYVDREGQIYDYSCGIDDAKAGRVRFIGDAGERIREDVLRILRFFRFYAWFGRIDADRDALAACRELADLIPRLSAERVARETLKLLSAPKPVLTWSLMGGCGVTQHFLAEASDIARLEHLIASEIKHRMISSSLLRLAALLPQEERTANLVAARLKLSNRDREKLSAFVVLPSVLHGNLDAASLRRVLYEYGPENCREALLLVGGTIDAALATVAAWDNPVFSIKGEDIVSLGIPAGPRIGLILREVEAWWIAGDFRAERAACLDCAAQYLRNS